MAIRGLILDFGGVMTTEMRLNGEAFERAENLEPGAYFHALEVNPIGVEVYARLETGLASQSEWNSVIGSILGVAPDDLMSRALANLRPEPRMIQAAELARAQGVSTALLSNSFGLTPFNVYKELGVLDLFDVTVLSEIEGVRKPDPAIYQRALDLLGLQGRECVYIDDVEDNLPPAAALGITVIHHTDPNTTLDHLTQLLAA